MAAELACPVCGLEHIAAERDRCPQCDADLTCFKVLSSLPDELPEKEPGHAKGIPAWAFIVLLAGLIAVVVAFQLHWFSRYEILLSEHQAAFADSMQNVVAALEHLAQDSQEPEISHTGLTPGGKPEHADLWTYRVRDGDTLWGISERYYGSGRYYPVLLEHNPHLRIYALARGMEVRILEDAEGAQKVYDGIVTREEDGIYWNYTVMKGDTIKSIGMRFYETKKLEHLILNLNPELQLKEGEKIKILLK